MKIPGYELLSPLGQGGMGVVWRAREVATQQLRAVKTVRVPSPHLIHAVRRELAMLRELAHPGVVTVTDHGLAQGVPWYAMELLVGPTLRELMQRAPAGSESLWREETLVTGASSPMVTGGRRPLAAVQPDSRVLEVFGEACRTLSWLHARGVVHLDLKPANIVVTDNGPVLVDFGIAVLEQGGVDRQRPHIAGPGVGTPHYMAPEQINGEALDARADMYALGCMLFEAYAGRPPFVGTLADIFDGHLHRPPPPLGEGAHWAGGGHSDTATMPRLQPLGPDPGPEPPAHVDTGGVERADLATTLALIPRLLAKDPAERLRYADVVCRSLGMEAAAATYVLPPTFVGRAAELQVAREHLRTRDPVRLAIVGQAGVGKTQLARQLVRWAVREGRTTVVCHAEPHAQAPFAPLGPLAERVADLEDAERRVVMGEDAPTLAALFPGLRPWSVPVPPVSERHAIAAVRRSLDRLALRHRLLVVLDDAQWAGEEVMSALMGSAVSVVATSRAALPAFSALTLATLSLDEVRDLVGSMLGWEDARQGWITALHRGAEGNPYFVAEFVRGAILAGQISRCGDSWSLPPDAVPPGLDASSRVRQMVMQTVARLAEPSRDLALSAATFGRRVDVAHLEGGHGGLRPLIANHLVRVVGDQLEFVHELVRQVLYESMGESDRARRHRACAAVFSRTPGFESERARHLDEAGSPGAAAAYLEALRKSGAYAQLEDLTQLAARGAALTSDPDILVSLAEEIGRAQLGRGRVADAGASAAVACLHAQGATPLSRGRAAILRGWTEVASGDPAAALATGDSVGPQPDAELESSRLRLLSMAALRLGLADRAAREAQAAVGASSGAGPLDAVRSLAQRALTALETRGTKDALPLYEAVEVAARAPGLERPRTAALCNLGLASLQLGDHEAAQRHLVDGLALGRRIDALGSVHWTLGIMGMLHHARSEYALARVCFAEAIDAGGVPGGLARSLLGCLLTETGPVQAAIDAQREALVEMPADQFSVHGVLCHVRLAEALHVAGDTAAADAVDLSGAQRWQALWVGAVRDVVAGAWTEAAGGFESAAVEADDARGAARAWVFAACARFRAGDNARRDAALEQAERVTHRMDAPYLAALMRFAGGAADDGSFAALGIGPDTLSAQLTGWVHGG